MTLLSWKSPKLTARTIAMAAILIAMQIVLSKLSIGPDNLVKFSFGFIATNIFFTTLWIHIMYKAPIMALLTVRVPKNILTWIVYSIVGFLVLRAVSRLNLRSNDNTY